MVCANHLINLDFPLPPAPLSHIGSIAVASSWSRSCVSRICSHSFPHVARCGISSHIALKEMYGSILSIH